MGPGSFVVKKRGIFHTFWNAGDETVRFLEVISPGGFERYFEEIPNYIPSDGPPDMEGLMGLAQRYGMDLDPSRIPEILEEHGVRLG